MAVGVFSAFHVLHRHASVAELGSVRPATLSARSSDSSSSAAFYWRSSLFPFPLREHAWQQARSDFEPARAGSRSGRPHSSSSAQTGYTLGQLSQASFVRFEQDGKLLVLIRTPLGVRLVHRCGGPEARCCSGEPTSTRSSEQEPAMGLSSDALPTSLTSAPVPARHGASSEIRLRHPHLRVAPSPCLIDALPICTVVGRCPSRLASHVAATSSSMSLPALSR